LSKRRVNEILLSLFKEGIVNRVRNNRNESFVYFLTSEGTKLSDVGQSN
jgi:predicted transcriptional regulator